MAIVRGNVSNTGSGSYIIGITWNHTVGDGVDRILMITITCYKYSTISPGINQVTYNGINCPIHVSVIDDDGGSPPRRLRSAIAYLLNPPVGTYQVYVQFTTDVYCAVGAVNYTGVDQITPFGTAQGNIGANPLTITVTTTFENEVAITQYGTNADGPLYANHTELWNVVYSIHSGCGEKVCPTAGNYNLTWTAAFKGVCALVGVPMKPSLPKPAVGSVAPAMELMGMI